MKIQVQSMTEEMGPVKALRCSTANLPKGQTQVHYVDANRQATQ